MDKKQIILWDWNGTLLDDVQFAINVRNTVFPRFGLPKIENLKSYQEQFAFPVKVYYQHAGVSEENFQAVASAWMDEYVAGCHAVPLFKDALDALDAFAHGGFLQVILSASKEDILRCQLKHAGILNRFDEVLGLSHIYATDKTGLAKSWLLKRNIDTGDCVLIGDTVHDALVADNIGLDCVLVARGHMSEQRLLETGRPVCNTLKEAVQWVLGRRTQRS